MHPLRRPTRYAHIVGLACALAACDRAPMSEGRPTLASTQPALLAACATDVDCGGEGWCDVAVATCTPTLPNGSAMPIDIAHVAPTLDGTCTTDAAALVCTSKVCDPLDDKCGLAEGDGPCVADAACRSGRCSADTRCVPTATGCNVDADCAAGSWCNELEHACTAKLPNGASMPNDPPHTSPTLNATCGPQAAALVCASGVCDATDHACGYRVGTGPCKTLGAAVCRSGRCGANDTCVPIDGCNVDADCASDEWCAAALHACVRKLPNGTPLPVDPPHLAPRLDGTCTPSAAAAVCATATCDPHDDRCGLADGSGPCTDADGAVVCRSGRCGSLGACIATACATDADCTDPGYPLCDDASRTCVAGLPAGTYAGGGACGLVGASGDAGAPFVLVVLGCAAFLVRRRSTESAT